MSPASRPAPSSGSSRTGQKQRWDGRRTCCCQRTPSARKEESRWLLLSTHRCRPAVLAVPSVMPPVVGGCTCGGVRPAATSVAATIRCPGTQHGIGERLDTRSSDRSNRARTGSGTTRAMTTTKVPNLPHRNAIPRTRQSPVLAIECRATGPTCSVSKTTEARPNTSDASSFAAHGRSRRRAKRIVHLAESTWSEE